eukprot:TRINITY_DN8804_c0_g1_i1.p1 TRINITY_DN8804_c0_g1~~TRINITY_DN8804_c0_g1_i1.p1  ORF type:complete len:536 (+),score=72.95 TRINITY_DN8804_c0_g1_i1:111-1718(+)
MVFRFPAAGSKPSADNTETITIKQIDDAGLPVDFKQYKFPETPPRESKSEPQTPRMTPRKAVTPDSKPSKNPKSTPEIKPLPKTGNRQRSTTRVGGAPSAAQASWAKVKGRVRSQTRVGNGPGIRPKPQKLNDKLLDSGKFSDKIPSITSPLKHKSPPHKNHHLGIPGSRKRSSPEAIQRKGSFFDTYVDRIASQEGKTEQSVEKMTSASVMSTIGELTAQLVQLRKSEGEMRKERDEAVGNLSKVSIRLEALESYSVEREIAALVAQEKSVRDCISWSASVFLISLSGVTDPVLVEASTHKQEIVAENEEILRKKIDVAEKVDWQIIMSKNLTRKHTAIVLQLHRTHGELTDTKRELAKAETDFVTQEKVIRELKQDLEDARKTYQSPVHSPRTPRERQPEGSRLENTNTPSPSPSPSPSPPSGEVTASVSVVHSSDLRAEEWDARFRGQQQARELVQLDVLKRSKSYTHPSPPSSSPIVAITSPGETSPRSPPGNRFGRTRTSTSTYSSVRLSPNSPKRLTTSLKTKSYGRFL